MRVIAKTIANTVLQMELDFNSYLEGPVSSSLCREHNDTDPQEVLESLLPYGYENLKDDELTEVLEEACLYAAGYSDDDTPAYIKPVAVKIDTDDLCLFKQRFFPFHGMTAFGINPFEAA